MYIYPYAAGSGSVRALRAANADLRIIRREGSRFRGDPSKVVINWGCTQLSEEVMKCKIVNDPAAVKIASDKGLFFDKVKDDVQVPEYSRDRAEAEAWVKAGEKVVVREVLNGHSGEGIVILDNLPLFEDYDHTKAKLYVKYIPKQDEYRIHVAEGDIVDKQRKAMRREFAAADVNWQVRNHANGFVFAREGTNPPEDVINQAVAAVKACGLDFGAVDVIWNNHRQKAYVLEVNTAPGLEGQSVDTYSDSLKKVVNRLNQPNPRRRNVFEAAVDEAMVRPVQPARVAGGEPDAGAAWDFIDDGF